MTGGYSIIAHLMGAYPELSIFRKFGALNARNILYLQAELADLEIKLLQAEKVDLESGNIDRKIYSRDWRTLAESVDTAEGNGTQWELFLRLREKLHEYNTAILEQAQISQLSSPNPRDLQFLVKYMKAPSMGNVYLLGPDSDIWENPNHLDLFAVNSKQIDNSLSRLITVLVVDWFHRLVGRRLGKTKDEENVPNTAIYSQARLERISRIVATTIASTLPIASIVVLYSIHNTPNRLAVVGLFTAVFSFVLALFTNGRAIEIFSATAAFAAVQVVFVGSTTRSPQDYTGSDLR